MKSQNFFKSIVVATLFFIGSVNLAIADTVSEWDWEDLIPENYVFQNPLDQLSDEEYEALVDDSEEAQKLMEEIKKMQDNAPIVEALDGAAGRISGYALPLDFEAQAISEFLLVPYFGACIHVPPPPGNQTVYVRLDEPMEIEELWDPVTVTGKMETVRLDTELAVAGYQMQAIDVEAYVFPENVE